MYVLSFGYAWYTSLVSMSFFMRFWVTIFVIIISFCSINSRKNKINKWINNENIIIAGIISVTATKSVFVLRYFSLFYFYVPTVACSNFYDRFYKRLCIVPGWLKALYFVWKNVTCFRAKHRWALKFTRQKTV